MKRQLWLDLNAARQKFEEVRETPEQYINLEASTIEVDSKKKIATKDKGGRDCYQNKDVFLKKRLSREF